MTRFTAGVAAVCLTFLAACDSPTMTGLRSAGGASFAKGGNSDAAHACQDGGWENLAQSDGTPFTNQGDCVSYAAHGGTLSPKVPVITSFTYDGIQSHCLPNDGGGTVGALFTAVFSGGTGTITPLLVGGPVPVTSGVQVELPITGIGYTLTVTNGSGSVSQTLTPFWSGTPGCSIGP